MYDFIQKFHSGWAYLVLLFLVLAVANSLMGFVRNIHPQLCERWRAAGLTIIADQIIAPAAEEQRQSQLQRERFAGWQDEAPEEYAAIARFERLTWSHLHHITCASAYVKQGLVAEGIPQEQISVLPYPFDMAWTDKATRTAKTPITVGFVGAVGLRKGAPYFLEVARRMACQQLRFVMVGPVH